MANQKISQLTPNTTPNGNEEFPFAYNNANGKMTTDTIKGYVNTWMQQQLVSGTNIKTINGNSLLWSWNITISWWGGWGWITWYDCVVDAWGNWDYTTIWAAIAWWNRIILVMPWTYNESEWNDIIDSWIVLHGMNPDTTIVNVTVDSSDPSYPYFIKIDWTADWIYTADIRNITFNVTYARRWTLMYWYSSSSDRKLFSSFTNCVINTTSSSDAVWNLIIYSYPSSLEEYAKLYNCRINITSDVSWHYTWLMSNNTIIFKECIFNIKTSYWYVWVNLDNLFNCTIVWRADWTWYTYTSLYNIYNTECEIYDNHSLDRWRLYVRWAYNSKIWHSYSVYPSTQVDLSTILPDREAAHAYTTWDLIWYNFTLYECLESHTSTSNIWDDEDKWQDVTWIEMWESSNSNIRFSSWNIKRIISIKWWMNKYDHSQYNDNHISWNNILSWWAIQFVWNIVNWNMQHRWAWSIFSWNVFYLNWWAYKLYYLDKYNSIVWNTLMSTNAPSITAINSTNTSVIEHNITTTFSNL